MNGALRNIETTIFQSNINNDRDKRKLQELLEGNTRKMKK